VSPVHNRDNPIKLKSESLHTQAWVENAYNGLVSHPSAGFVAPPGLTGMFIMCRFTVTNDIASSFAKTVAMCWELYPVFSVPDTSRSQQFTEDYCDEKRSIQTNGLLAARATWTDRVSDGWSQIAQLIVTP